MTIPVNPVTAPAVASSTGDSGVGTVVAWGSDEYGQASVPAGLTGVVAVAAGQLHSLALKDDGTVVAWGRNSHGQARVPPGLTVCGQSLPA